MARVQLRSSTASQQEIADLSRQLSAFLRSGIPITEALDVMTSETPAAHMRTLLREVGVQLREGDSFAEAMSTHAEHLPAYYPGIVRSAELSGRLDDVLDQLADYIDRDQETRRRLRAALIYPSILAAMSIVTVIILVGFVLPKFQGFFVGLNAELPTSTKILLSLGDFMKASGLELGAGVGVGVALLFLFARSERGKNVRDRLALRLPVVRSIVQAAVIERFCRILSTMVRGGIPIADGMTAAIESSNNRVFARRLVTAAEEMLEGGGFAAPIAATGMFPGMVTQMMRVGEETGTLDRQLDVAARYYERELAHRLTKLTALFEPAIIIAMGVIVGFISVALVQAMYGVYSQGQG